MNSKFTNHNIRLECSKLIERFRCSLAQPGIGAGWGGGVGGGRLPCKDLKDDRDACCLAEG